MRGVCSNMLSKVIYGTFISQEMIKNELDARVINRYGDRLTREFEFKHLRNPGNEIMYVGSTVLDVDDCHLNVRSLGDAYKSVTFGTKLLVTDSIRTLPYDLKKILPHVGLYFIGSAMDDVRGKYW